MVKLHILSLCTEQVYMHYSYFKYFRKMQIGTSQDISEKDSQLLFQETDHNLISISPLLRVIFITTVMNYS